MSSSRSRAQSLPQSSETASASDAVAPSFGASSSGASSTDAPTADLFGREILARVVAGARARGAAPRQRHRDRGHEPRVRRDSRDPMLVGDSLDSLIVTRGWSANISVAAVTARWREIAGDQIADHCEPVEYADGVLTLKASSTAWATQMQMLSGQLLQAIARELGDGVVTTVQVTGPVGRSFRRGPKSVKGRGPRDTWG